MIQPKQDWILKITPGLVNTRNFQDVILHILFLKDFLKSVSSAVVSSRSQIRSGRERKGYPSFLKSLFFPNSWSFPEMFYHQTVRTSVFPNQNRSGLKKSLHQSDSSSRRYASPKSHRGSKRGASACKQEVICLSNLPQTLGKNGFKKCTYLWIYTVYL